MLSTKVNELKEQLAIVRRRMSIEKDDNRYQALALEFDGIHSACRAAEAELALKQRSLPPEACRSPEAEVDTALSLLDDICRIAQDDRARAEVNPLLRKLGMWLGLTFDSTIKGEKRLVRRLVGGMMTFGDRKLPVPLFGADNRQDPDHGSSHAHSHSNCGDETSVKSRPGEPSPEKNTNQTQNAGECPDNEESAATGALAPITADLNCERPGHLNVENASANISFTMGSRGDWIRTSDLTVPNRAL